MGISPLRRGLTNIHHCHGNKVHDLALPEDFGEPTAAHEFHFDATEESVYGEAQNYKIEDDLTL